MNFQKTLLYRENVKTKYLLYTFKLIFHSKHTLWDSIEKNQI